MTGPYSEELSTDKLNFFMYNSDFEAYLNNALFWEFKRTDLWQNITNKDWDDSVSLAINTAFEAFVAQRTGESP